MQTCVSGKGGFACLLRALGPLHRLADQLACALGTVQAFDLHPFAGFQILVVLEEVDNALDQMSGRSV